MIELLEGHGGGALVASTLALAVGAVAVLWTRRWDSRQLTAELAIATATLAGLQAFAPLGLIQHQEPVRVEVHGGERPSLAQSPVAPGPVVSADRQPAKRATGEAALSVTPRTIPAQPRPARDLAVPTPSLTWLALGSSLLVALYGLLGWVVVLRLHRRSQLAPDSVSSAVDELVGRSVDTRLVPTSATAFCYGLLSPRLALPFHLMARGGDRCLESVLHHEASHLRRKDPLRRVLVTAVAPLLFWNPLYWWLAREAALCAEYIADDSATRALGRRRYARELLMLAAPIVHNPSALRPSGSQFLRRKGELRRRILMLHHSAPDLSTRTSRLGRCSRTTFASITLAALTLGVGRSPGQDPLPGEAMTQAPQRLFEVEIQVENSQDLGAFLAQLSDQGIGGSPWLTVSIKPGKTSGQHQLHLRGVPKDAFAQIQLEAQHAGVQVLSAMSTQGAQEHKPVPTHGPPNDNSTAALLRGSEESMQEVLQAIGSIQTLLETAASNDTGTLGRLLEDTSVHASVAEMMQSLNFGPAVKGTTPPTAAPQDPGPLFTLEAKNIAIEELVMSIAEVSGANFVLSPDVQGSLTVGFHDVHWREALEASVHAVGFRVIEERGGVLRITAETRVTPILRASGFNAQPRTIAEHVVRQGDSLARIAASVYGRNDLALALGKANKLVANDTLSVGQVLALPSVEDLLRLK